MRLLPGWPVCERVLPGDVLREPALLLRLLLERLLSSPQLALSHLEVHSSELLITRLTTRFLTRLFLDLLLSWGKLGTPASLYLDVLFLALELQ